MYCITVLGPRSLKSRSFWIGSFQGCEGKSVLCPSSGGLMEIFDIPWLVDISLQSLPLLSHGILPMCLYLCLCLFSSSYKDTSPIGSKANPNDSILTCLRLPRCYFQIRSHSNKVLEIKTAAYLFTTTHDRI